MKFFIILSFLTSIVSSQFYYGPGASLSDISISQSSSGSNLSATGGSSISVNGIKISGNSGNPVNPSNHRNQIDVNNVHIDGQNGALSAPIRINQGSKNENIRVGPNRAPSPNSFAYPQNNAYANRRPEYYYPQNPQIAAPAPVRPSIQYPGISNSLNNGNDVFKNTIPGVGGLTLPIPYWG